MAFLGICGVIQNGGQDGHYLGLYSKLKLIERVRKLKILFARMVKYDLFKYFAALSSMIFSQKKGEKHALISCYLIRYVS